MIINTSDEVLSRTLTAAYSSALPAVCSGPGTTPKLFSGCPSCAQTRHPDLRILWCAGWAAPQSV
eukprot:7385012-Heterocapsa_arctica.AAC.1